MSRLAFPKPERRELPEYLKWVRQQPCVVHRCYRKTEASHIVFNGQGRLGSKVQDTQAVAMCRMHHRSYHIIGRDGFEQRHGLNLAQEIIDLLTDYLLSREDA
jgi:hypothetical protein